MAKLNAADLAKAQAKAVQLHEAGKGWAEIRQATGLNHSQCDLAWYAHCSKQPGGYRGAKWVGGPAWQAKTDAAQLAQLVAWRAASVSWGVMAAVTEQPESKLRTQFETGTKLATTGLRVGHGGRWWRNEQGYYQGNMKGHGVGHQPRVVPPVPTPEQAAKAANPVARLTKAQRKAKAKVQAEVQAQPATTEPAAQ